MAGYTPVFNTVFDGTLHSKWPQTGVWLALLAMTDKSGHIDRSPQAIASDIGIDVDTLMRCITEFCAPDPMSRTQDHDGRRLELIEEGRSWGWKVINHGKYRERARLMAKNQSEVESGSNRERLSDRRRPPATAAHRPSYADADSYTDKNSPSRSSLPDNYQFLDSSGTRMQDTLKGLAESKKL